MLLLRQYFAQVVLFAVFAVWLPLQKGLSFLDPVALGAYASLGVIFAAPAAASGVPVFRAVRNGLALSWAMLLIGAGTVYFSRTVVVGPDLRSLAECGLFGLGLSFAVASIVAFTAGRASVSIAKIVARLLLLSLLALFYFWSGWLPAVAWRGAALCAGIAAVFLILSRRRA
jgi:hypothetical protein